MPGYNSQRRGTAPTLPKNFCVAQCIVCFVSICVLFLCKCALCYCHRVATQLQFNKYIISYVRTELWDGQTGGVVLIGSPRGFQRA
jgi:hypothetical protein